jgi:hypothetical protein
MQLSVVCSCSRRESRERTIGFFKGGNERLQSRESWDFELDTSTFLSTRQRYSVIRYRQRRKEADVKGLKPKSVIISFRSYVRTSFHYLRRHLSQGQLKGSSATCGADVFQDIIVGWSKCAIFHMVLISCHPSARSGLTRYSHPI